MANLRLEHVTKRFGDFTAVEDFDLRINDGEFVVLVGPSGCGKSTTLRMVAGLETATEGNIYIGDRNVTKLPPRSRDIAMVFQNYALYPHLDIYKNLSFGLRMKKFSRKEIDKRVNEAADILGIAEQLPKKPRELSGGQRQRVAMGRAIVRHPKVFLFDEPLSNLDAKLRIQMRVELSRIHHTLQTTTVYVTHDQSEAMTLGDRVVILKEGEVQQVDVPQELYDHPANKFVAGFIGSPTMNFLPGRIERTDGERLVIDINDTKLPIPEKHRKKIIAAGETQFTFGIRPEDIHPVAVRKPGLAKGIVNAHLEVTEAMGSDIYLYLDLGGHEIVARFDPAVELALGEDMDIIFDMNKMHLFDTENEKTIV